MTTRTWTDWSCTVSVTVEDPAAAAAAEQVVRDVMDAVARAVSIFTADSDLARVNAAGGRMIPVRPLTVALVRAGLDAARRTDGAVDPTVGGTLRRLGYDADIDVVRAAPRGTGPARPVPGWRVVRVDEVLGRIGVPAGTTLDLGASAKAWAADEAAARIAERFATASLVGIGGDLGTAGQPREPWRIDVAERSGDPAQRIGLEHGGLATSSTTGRRWTTLEGTAAHHVIDPRTGAPASSRWRSASVWAPSALEANVLSTWALVDAEAAAAALEADGRAARLTRQDGTAEMLGAWPVEELVP